MQQRLWRAAPVVWLALVAAVGCADDGGAGTGDAAVADGGPADGAGGDAGGADTLDAGPADVADTGGAGGADATDASSSGDVPGAGDAADAAMDGMADGGDSGQDSGGAPDGGEADTTGGDAGPIDAGPIDAGPIDAGPLDAGPIDAAPTDAGPDDAAPTDAGPGDAGGDATEPPAGACLPEPVRFELSEHLTSLLGFLKLADGHASASEAVGFLTLPHWDAAGPSFAFLFMPCEGPVLYDPYCDGLVCAQIECNDDAPTWTHHSTPFQSPLAHGGWTYTDCANHVRWTGVGDTLEVTESCTAVDGDGTDYTVTGTALLAGDLITVEQSYTHLVKGHVAVLTAEADLTAVDATGELRVGGVLTALVVQGVGGDLALHPVGACAGE